MTTVRSDVLLPSQFLSKSKKDSVPLGVKDEEAYKELISNCATLKVKINKVLAGRVDAIRHNTVVDLTRNYIGAMGLQAITSLLAKNENLKVLHLPGSGLNNDSVVFFCRSVMTHPTLTEMDFSSNAISLAGGLALLSLIQQNHHVCEVHLGDTQIPSAVLGKIQIALERNAGYATTHANTTMKTNTATVSAPSLHSTGVATEEALLRGTLPTSLRETVRRAEWSRRESEALTRLAALFSADIPPLSAAVEAARDAFVPPPHMESGWRLLEVAILAPPFLFESEVQLLLHNVFPRLNAELIDRKVHLIPLVSPPDEAAGTYLRHLRFTIAADLMRDVDKSRMFAIELIGDRAGDYELLPASEMSRRPGLLQHLTATTKAKTVGEASASVAAANRHPIHTAATTTAMVSTTSGKLCKIRAIGEDATIVAADDDTAAPPLRPVLRRAHERASEVASWLIVGARRATCRLGLPPSLAPLLTEEPPVEHPDRLRSLVRRTVAVGAEAVCAAQRLAYDTTVRERQWRQQRAFRTAATEGKLIQELIFDDYSATFDHCGEDGQVHLRELEEFEAAVYNRIQIIAKESFPRCTDGHPAGFQGCYLNSAAEKRLALHKVRLQAFLQHCAISALPKKSITNRLDLYVIAPPSRNAFVLHGTEPSALTSLVGAFTAGIMAKESRRFRVAYHTTRSPFLSEEPSDLREMICNIILQLAPEKKILRRALGEADITRLQHIFTEILTERRRGNETITSTTNTNTSNADAAASGTTEPLTTVVVLDGLDRILPPVMPCAALRISPETGKDVWGMESHGTDPLSYIPHCLARYVRLVVSCTTGGAVQPRLEGRGRDSAELLPLGQISPNDFDEMLSPDAMTRLGVTISDDDFVLLRKKEEALSPEYMIFVADALRAHGEAPGVESQTATAASLPGTARAMAQRCFDAARDALGAAVVHTCARLLQHSRWGIYEPQLRAMLQLPQRRFNQLLRILRPLLEQASPPALGVAGGNALYVRVCIRAPVFYDILEREELQTEGSEEDQRVWHDILTNCYLRVVYEVVDRENTPPLFGLISTSPYERMAVKELPYHAVRAGALHILHRFVLSMPYLMLVYRNCVGFHFVRELIAVFNTLHELFELGEYTDDVAYASYTTSIKSASATDAGARSSVTGIRTTTAGTTATATSVQSSVRRSPSLERLREYIYFLRQYNARLTEHPHLVLQTALEASGYYNLVGSDAREFITRKMTPSAPLALRQAVFFDVVAPSRARFHHGAVTSCYFSPRGITRIATCSEDRSVCTVNPLTGALIVQARHAPSRVERLLFCPTGAYHAAICVDRTIIIYDTAQMKLITRLDGGTFHAPIADVSFSARGRYLLVATADLNLRAFETERGLVFLHQDQRHLLQHQGNNHSSNHHGTKKKEGEGEAENNNNNNVKANQGSAEGDAERAARAVRLCGAPCTVMPHTTSDEEFYSTCDDLLMHWALNPTRDGFVCAGENPLSLSAQSGHALVEGDLLLLLPTVGPPSGRDGGHLCCANTGRTVARLETPRPARLHRISTDERLVATALDDGSITLHQIQLERLAERGGALIVVPPLLHLAAFRPSPVPVVIGMRFCAENIEGGKSIGIFALGNTNEMRFWALPRRALPPTPAGDEQQDGSELIEGIADGGFLLDKDEVTSWDVASTVSPNGAEIVFGDSTGRLTLLRMWSPFM